MSAGRICLYSDGLIALACIRSLETQPTLTTDGEERDVGSRLVRRRVSRANDLPGCATTCVQNIDKPTRSAHQYLDGVNPAGAIGRVLRRCQLAKVVIDSEAGNLLVLSAGHVEVADCVIRTAGGHSKSQSEGHYKRQTNLAEFPELHAFPSSPSPCGL